MERESFEDHEVANYLNQYFVAIKVDREERPDVDHLYMNVCTAMTGQGGWPLTLILTPDKKPFFAGTYFPKTRKYGHIGLLELLPQLIEVWQHERYKAESIGEQLTHSLQEFTSNQSKSADLTPEPEFFTTLYAELQQEFDQRYAGFGDAPKFPSPQNILFLLRHYTLTKDEQALHMALTTLEKMHRGGIFDHIGGGFARYSTDRKWLIPHFEKMLYDNALLAHAYLDAFHLTHDPVWKGIAISILDYVLREMHSEEGAFYAAQDADAQGEEGKFYTFTTAEITSILHDEAEAFVRFFGMTDKGNFEEKNVLHLQSINDQEWRDWVLQSHHQDKHMTALVNKVYAYREQRVPPFKDDKVLLGWNGLMISAFAKAERLFGDGQYGNAAIAAHDFLMEHLRSEDGRLLARYRDGEVKHPAVLDDYAYFAWAQLELYELTMDVKYLQNAIECAQDIQRLFGDESGGGYFLSGYDAEALVIRMKSWYDGALPSGNSVATYVLAKLASLTGDVPLIAERDAQIQAVYAQANQHPAGYAFFAIALQLVLFPAKEVVVAANDIDQALDWVRLIQKQFRPQMSLLVRNDKDAHTFNQLAPFTKGQNPQHGELTAYVCEHFTCHSPVTNWESLSNLLDG